jgi:hypothetical protein
LPGEIFLKISKIGNPLSRGKKTGFIGRGHEYSLLARAELKSLREEQHNRESRLSTVAKRVAGRLDDSSMSHVNELMLNLTMVSK